MADTSLTNLLKSHAHEMVKSHTVYDLTLRATVTYTAITNAPDGAPCLKTQYAYDGASSRITDRKESQGVWDSDWDVLT